MGCKSSKQEMATIGYCEEITEDMMLKRYIKIHQEELKQIENCNENDNFITLKEELEKKN